MSGAVAFALHGGAGVIDPADFPPARRAQCADTLGAIARRAAAALNAGSSALDVVEQAVVELEESPLFNAGFGAVLNADGAVELDAAVMDGAQRRAGAVAAICRTRNPVRAARAVCEHGEHVLLVGAGADQFAREAGLEQVDPQWFVLDERKQQLILAKAAGRVCLDHDASYGAVERTSGTVGAVARDGRGHVAAATSTGGMTNKRPGRVGDSPLIGCGTWADDRSCALSATGHGEFFIRAVLAHEVAARMRHAGMALEQAMQETLAEVAALGGSGGAIAVAAQGPALFAFNSPGMYRARIGATGAIEVGIYPQLEP